MYLRTYRKRLGDYAAMGRHQLPEKTLRIEKLMRTTHPLSFCSQKNTSYIMRGKTQNYILEVFVMTKMQKLMVRETARIAVASGAGMFIRKNYTFYNERRWTRLRSSCRLIPVEASPLKFLCGIF